jgi:hypothetical protein
MRISLFSLLLLAAVPALAQADTEIVPVSPDVRLYVMTDPMTDEVRTTVDVSPDPAELSVTVFCGARGPAVSVIHKYLGGRDDKVEFTWRVDDDAPVTVRRAHLSRGNRMTFPYLLDQAGARRFIDAMAAGRLLRTRMVDPLDGETLNEAAQLDGVRGALERLPCYSPAN